MNGVGKARRGPCLRHPWCSRSWQASSYPKTGGVEQMYAGGCGVEAHRIADVRMKTAGQLDDDRLVGVARDVHHRQAAEIFDDAHGP